MSLYRCAECGHGEKLYALAYGYIEGPLGADGSLERHDRCEETELAEDTIACHEHGDSVLIEKRVEGIWCRWAPCERCGGCGREVDSYGNRDIGYCQRNGYGKPGCGGSGGAWESQQPLRDPQPPSLSLSKRR